MPDPDLPMPPPVVRSPEIAALGGGMHHHAGPHACSPAGVACPYWTAVAAWVDGRSAREFVDDHPELLGVLGLVELAHADEVPLYGLYFVDRDARSPIELGELMDVASREVGVPVNIASA